MLLTLVIISFVSSISFEIVKRWLNSVFFQLAQENENCSTDTKPVQKEEISANEWTPYGDVQDVEKEKAYLSTLSAVEVFAYRQNKLVEKKQKIASLSHAVLEDPQNNVISFS